MNSRKTRVCIITVGHWSAIMGGIQYQVKCLAEQMVTDGHFDIFYLSRIVDPGYKPQSYTIVPICNNFRSLKTVFVLDAPALLKSLTVIRPDIIYQHGLNSYTGIIAYYARNNDCKFIFHIASDYDVIPLAKQEAAWHRGPAWIEKRVGELGLKRADFVVAQTERQRWLLHRHYKLSASLLIRNFHPFPEESIQKRSSPIEVVWVANFKPVKRPEMFVQLAEDLRGEENARFIMIGRPGDLRHYRKLHERIRRCENLVYLGELPIERVNELLSTAHIFVNTSIAEGFPNTFIQAWMRRMPVVSAGVDPDGTMEREGIGFSDGTYEYLRGCVVRLIHDQRLRNTMGDAAQAYAYRNHSMANVVPLFELMRGFRREL